MVILPFNCISKEIEHTMTKNANKKTIICGPDCLMQKNPLYGIKKHKNY